MITQICSHYHLSCKLGILHVNLSRLKRKGLWVIVRSFNIGNIRSHSVNSKCQDWCHNQPEVPYWTLIKYCLKVSVWFYMHEPQFSTPVLLLVSLLSSNSELNENKQKEWILVCTNPFNKLKQWSAIHVPICKYNSKIKKLIYVFLFFM